MGEETDTKPPWRISGELEQYIQILSKKLDKKDAYWKEVDDYVKSGTKNLTVREKEELQRHVEERLKLCELKKLQKMSPHEYIQETVAPFLDVALERLNKIRPVDPIAFLAGNLLEYKALMDKFQEEVKMELKK